VPWIKRQLLSAKRQTERQMLSGETDYAWGQRYRLDTSREGRPQVAVQGSNLYVTAPADFDTDAPAHIVELVVPASAQRGAAAAAKKWQPVTGVEVDKMLCAE